MHDVPTAPPAGPPAEVPAELITAEVVAPAPLALEPVGQDLFSVVGVLLRSPASVVHAMRERRDILWKLGIVTFLSMVVTGVVMAAFSGGLQLLWVPLKLSLGFFVSALICLPSLYIFTSLSGGRQSLRETWGALLMGITLMGILMVAFAPVSWLFSQATSSAAFMGSLHVCFFFVASYFGIGLIRRSLAMGAGGATPRGTAIWSLLFLLVALQMSTTLRPLIGPDDGLLFHPKQFFLVHWITG
ncbi:MAG: hypothetical protein AAGE52_40625 [Myxococcota bacterium]